MSYEFLFYIIVFFAVCYYLGIFINQKDENEIIFINKHKVPPLKGSNLFAKNSFDEIKKEKNSNNDIEELFENLEKEI
ncbi:MAG: Unknown protein [uncultured Campylobacterales bacterium]|uniref:Uncharacterized protein n=1 Tax=uncultured Campylobacterales bacterium TaxID=352960 RepID=A0A6S6SQU1_9BACT|nr:MAG: Unknown protein [uncultured Campylobacterales bacterium]